MGHTVTKVAEPFKKIIGKDNPLTKFAMGGIKKVVGEKNSKYVDMLVETPDESLKGGIFGKAGMLAPDPGSPPALDPIPTPDSAAPELAAAAAGQRRAKGRASTMLAAGTGSSSGVVSSRRTLLGS